jgi:hypothetical protein
VRVRRFRRAQLLDGLDQRHPNGPEDILLQAKGYRPHGQVQVPAGAPRHLRARASRQHRLAASLSEHCLSMILILIIEII